MRLYLNTISFEIKSPAKLPVSRRATTSIPTHVSSRGSEDSGTDRKSDVAVSEVKVASNLPRLLLAQFLLAADDMMVTIGMQEAKGHS